MKDIMANLLTSAKEHVFGLYLHYLVAVFLLIVSICGIGKWYGVLNLNQVIQISGTGCTILAIIFAGFQFKANHDWNRRHAAIAAADQVHREVAEPTIILDDAFNYIRRRTEEPISVDAIHQAICKKEEDEKLVRDEDDKLVIDHDGDGGKIKKALMVRLNSLEYLATGVVQGIFDETVIYKLTGGTLISTYQIFEKYIQHINDMYPERDGKIYENLAYIADKFIKSEKEARERVKERGKTG